MQQHVAMLCLLAFVSGCRSDTTVTAPSTVQWVASPAASGLPPYGTQAFVRQISIGEQASSALVAHDTYATFELTVPADGKVVARLNWDPNDGRLEVFLGDQHIVPSENNGSIVATFVVSASRMHRIVVADGAPWDYDSLDLPFVLTTSIEPSSNAGSPWDY
jgi:hypothetical protein